MADLERTYNIPLRKGIAKAPKYMRANKAVRVLREFLQRHMKSQTVKLGPNLNSKILNHGRKNIPHHIEVKAVKDKDSIVRAELASAKDLSFLEPKKPEEKEDKVKLKIPGLGKKKEEKKPAPKKEKALEKPSEKVEEKVTKEEKAPEVKVDKEKSVMTKEDKVYGRSDKKPKVKERAKKSK